MVKYHTKAAEKFLTGLLKNPTEEWFEIAGSAFEVIWLDPPEEIDVKALVDM